MRIDAREHLRVVADPSVAQRSSEDLAGVPAVMSPLEAAEIYARQADELAATAERLEELNTQQGRMLRALAAAFGELHTVLDELSAALGGDPHDA